MASNANVKAKMRWPGLNMLAVLVFMCQAALADTEIVPIDINFFRAYLTETITEADANRFEALEKNVKTLTGMTGKSLAMIVDVNSAGGDVTAAMRIGRVLRRMKSMVAVRGGAVCASSCVLVIAGAGYRSIEENTKIGIHRPYQVKAEESTPEKEKQKFAVLQRKIEEYLDEMNIARSLYHDMLRISPQDVRFLTRREIESYGLGQDDPYIEEANELRMAKELGISRKELANRRARVFKVCGGWPETSDMVALEKRLDCTGRVLKTGQ